MTATSSERPGSLFYVIVSGVALATIGLVLLGNPLLAVVPTLAAGLLFALFKGSLRIPILAMVTVAFVIDNPSDHGPWQSPFYTLGELLLIQVKKVIPIDALVLTGVDCILILLMSIYAYRKVKGLPTDSHRVVKAPPALLLACLVSIGMSLFSLAWGILRGGEFQWAQWQLLKMLRLPLVMLAFAALLPGPSVAPTIMRIIVGSAMVKAVIAIAISRAHPTADTMTSHQDSILFATASCAVAVHLLEKPGRRALLLNALIQPLLLYGMVVNDRRLVWVQLAMSLVMVFYSSSWSWVKFRLVRLVISGIPIAMVYLAVGWHSPTGIFRPVGTIKSMADSDEDGSTKWRDLENYNLYKTLASSPLTGTGLGHPFHEVIKMPDVTSIYPLEPYVPHNNMLGHWAYNGYVGFSAWWMVLVLVAYYAHRAYQTARAPPDRIFALTTLATLTTYMLQVYGDVGMSAWHGVFTVATTGVITAKIAVANGALGESLAPRDSAQPAWPRGSSVPRARLKSAAPQGRSA